MNNRTTPTAPFNEANPAIGPSGLADRPKNLALENCENNNNINVLADLAVPMGGMESIESILDMIAEALKRHLVLPPMAAEAIALWVSFTHCFDAFDISPRLAFLSPVAGCGKTETFKIISHMAKNAVLASNISSAAIYRIPAGCTLLLDELDTQVDGNEALRGILNSGHSREGATVLRTAKSDGNETKSDWATNTYSTWMPIGMAKIGRLHDTWATRSIIIHMKKKRPDEHHPHPTRKNKDAFKLLNAELDKWSKEAIKLLREANPKMPEGIANRTADNWHPLLAIADLVGGHWPETARKAALALSNSTRDPPRGEMLLTIIKGVFRNHSALWSDEIIEGIRKHDDGDLFAGVTSRQLAKLLEPFDIKPTQVFKHATNKRGYKKADFEDAWKRYT
ncbi:DUF3631 domain-containing protein [Rhizobium sp. BK251]|uniref:DUF3631 domain-containing protein n=1 Tax=Rhizobium sp. BK251 TaxID=2512125 RepID=UPI001046631F|nr:DUF3631 domain-containing protein [Rhizobium sp. BK251]TCL70455.1 uncharacterized protein DUF3631 [Rhizobium sp. BK251]